METFESPLSRVRLATNKIRKMEIPGQDFFACYLLHALRPEHRGHAYIGSTPDPIRRLRQHNGEIVGGAKKTSKKRPWAMVLFVHGFPTRLAALQDRSPTSNRRPHYMYRVGTSLEVLASLLESTAFAGWPLHVHAIDPPAGVRLPAFPERPGVPIRVSSGPLKRGPSHTAQSLLSGPCHCRKTTAAGRVEMATCPSCGAWAHLQCWAARAIDSTTGNGKQRLVPIAATCAACGACSEWPVLAASARRGLALESADDNIDDLEVDASDASMDDDDSGPPPAAAPAITLTPGAAAVHQLLRGVTEATTASRSAVAARAAVSESTGRTGHSATVAAYMAARYASSTEARPPQTPLPSSQRGGGSGLVDDDDVLVSSVRRLSLARRQ
ncbi:hypothetical protein BC828DRAFT_394015 [Blastocladiella britannica]|nr:hypothetical protein BC828DRAFT_394015 [Blastocladiella britannica]